MYRNQSRPLEVVPVERRSAVLKKAAFGCLKDIFSVNVTRGCLHQCTYCYARSFPEVPRHQVLLYENLPELLHKEVIRRRQRATLPRAVAFSTASDLFQPHQAILHTTFKSLRLLLEAGVSVTFLTKGRINQESWALFAAHKDLVQARFGLVSLNTSYYRLYEPHTAPPFTRLKYIEKSALLGLCPAVRVDPVIPEVTDREEEIESLLRHLANVGVKEVSVSYLVLRPSVARQMRRELPQALWSQVARAFWGQPWARVITSATTKLVRREIRQKGYNLFREIGRAYGIKVRICGCKNPDLPFESCAPWDFRTLTPRQKVPKQQDLFRGRP